MAIYGSNYVITVNMYRRTVGALAHAEAMVRGALDRAPAQPTRWGRNRGAPIVDADRGETVIKWLAYVPGTDHGPAAFVDWAPGTEPPHGATELHCRGRRTV